MAEANTQKFHRFFAAAEWARPIRTIKKCRKNGLKLFVFQKCNSVVLLDFVGTSVGKRKHFKDRSKSWISTCGIECCNISDNVSHVGRDIWYMGSIGASQLPCIHWKKRKISKRRNYFQTRILFDDVVLFYDFDIRECKEFFQHSMKDQEESWKNCNDEVYSFYNFSRFNRTISYKKIERLLNKLTNWD